MIWKNVTIADLSLLQNAAFACDCMDNNAGAVNSVLYAKKLGMEICISDGWIFRRFFEGGKLCLFFPCLVEKPVCDSEQPICHSERICNEVSSGQGISLKDAILSLVEDSSKAGQDVIFVSLTKDQKETLESIFPKMKFSQTPERSDYIYLSKNLAALEGSKLSRKRNHIHQFTRKNPNYKIEELKSSNLNDAMLIEKKWFLENSEQNPEEVRDLNAEKEIIKFALDNFSFFAEYAEMTGAILYVQTNPVAFCVTSHLSEDIIDVHFEKCIEPFAKDGGYAVINQQFAKTVKAKFINREEDLGIEHLRKAKLSYFPEIVLEKWRGEF